MDARSLAELWGDDSDDDLLMELLSESSDSALSTDPEFSRAALMSSGSSHPPLSRLASKRRRAKDDNIVAVRKSGGIYVKRRADGRYLTHVVLPKILKSDIRRSIPQMYCNMQNSDDPRAMMKFLATFASKDLIFQHIMFSGDPNSTWTTLYGSRQAGIYWNKLSEMMPDKTLRLLGAKVRARSDGTGVVECDVELCGTVILRDSDPSHAQWIESIRCSPPEETGEKRSSALVVPTSGGVQLVAKRSLGRMRFHMDSSNIIQQLDYEKSVLPTVTPGAC